MNKGIEDFKNILLGNYWDKRNLIKLHLYINIFAYNKERICRGEVAVQGYYHEILQYDVEWGVRCNVAEFSKDKFILEHLANDEDITVRDKAKERLNKLYGK